jgi:superoxide dismutase, Cu-Zn family
MTAEGEVLRSHVVPLDAGSGGVQPVIEEAARARLVLLGEATHRTHEFYAIRAAITQALVARHGFNLIAVEADWPDAYRVNRWVRHEGHDATARAALGAFTRFPRWMWRNTAIVRLVEWLRADRGSGRSGDRRPGGHRGRAARGGPVGAGAPVVWTGTTAAEPCRVSWDAEGGQDMWDRTVAAVAAGCVFSFAALAAQGGQEQKGGQTGSQAAAGQGATKQEARAELKDRDGKTIGRATLTETPHGVLVRVMLEGAPAGERAFHIHEVGRCDPPGFESAGSHLNPNKADHGFHAQGGPHAGDLPNIHVPSDGKLTVEVLARGVTLRSGQHALLDGDGAALVMHAKPDDYRTGPAGAAGDRIACGVIQQ